MRGRWPGCGPGDLGRRPPGPGALAGALGAVPGFEGRRGACCGRVGVQPRQLPCYEARGCSQDRLGASWGLATHALPSIPESTQQLMQAASERAGPDPRTPAPQGVAAEAAASGRGAGLGVAAAAAAAWPFLPAPWPPASAAL